jgi:hypothetical protein
LEQSSAAVLELQQRVEQRAESTLERLASTPEAALRAVQERVEGLEGRVRSLGWGILVLALGVIAALVLALLD